MTIFDLNLSKLPRFPSPVGTLACEQEPEAWFAPNLKGARPIGGQRRLTKEQKACYDCPVRKDCLRYALSNDEEYGTWGGLTPYEREHLNGEDDLYDDVTEYSSVA